MFPERFRHSLHNLGLLVLAGVFMIQLAGCAPRLAPPGPAVGEPYRSAEGYVMADGTLLPADVTPAKGGEDPRAVLLAVHGFNDYANAFHDAAAVWAEHGITTVAYDQRGFGRTPTKGMWAGSDAMADDLMTVFTLVRTEYPGKPVYVLGESMGGAVVTVAAAGIRDAGGKRIGGQGGLEGAAGLILSAPAYWGRQTMPWYERAGIWFGAHTLPWLAVRPQLDIRPSDNIEMLRAMSRDPHVIKETRIDSAWGLVNLMSEAFDDIPDVPETNVLVLLGRNEEVLSSRSVAMAKERMPESWKLIEFDSGFHMLFRDLNGGQAVDAVTHFIEGQDGKSTVSGPKGDLDQDKIRSAGGTS